QGCVPHNTEFTFLRKVQKNLDYLIFLDDQSDPDTIYFGPNDTILPTIKHTYTKYGNFNTFAYLMSKGGCSNTYQLEVTMGYVNLFSSDTAVCKGQLVTFLDSVRYFYPYDSFWRDTLRASS